MCYGAVNRNPGLLLLYACTVHTLSGGSLAARAGGGGVGAIACRGGASACRGGASACRGGAIACRRGAIDSGGIACFRQRRDCCNINERNLATWSPAERPWHYLPFMMV